MNKTLKAMFDEWMAHEEEQKARYNEIIDLINWYFKQDYCDFSYFKLKKEVHDNKKPCGIYGIAHDWIATYPDTEWESQKVLKVTSDLVADKNDVIRVMITYFNGDYNYAEIPLQAMDNVDSFKRWYDEQLANYKANRDELADYINHREEITKSEAFKKWLEAGDQYVQLGMVRLTEHGEDVLHGSRR